MASQALRTGIAGAFALTLAAVAAFLLGRPDTGEPVVTAAPKPSPPAPPPPGRRGPRRPTDAGTPTLGGAPAPVGDEAALRRTYDADARGLGQAIVLRRDRLQACWDEFLARTPEVEGRFTLRLTLPRGATRAELEVTNADFDADLEACAAAALSDATFAPAASPQSLVYPVPVSG